MSNPSTAPLIPTPLTVLGLSGSLRAGSTNAAVLAAAQALDWLVPSLEFPSKPVAVVNASAFSSHAHAALLETLKTMSARMMPATIVTLPWTGKSWIVRA